MTTTTTQNEFTVLLEQAVSRARREATLRRMLVWLLALREAYADHTTRRHQAYEQLMLAELALGTGDRAIALERIGLAKGLLAVLMLALVVAGVLGGVDDAMRRPRGGSRIQVVRLARRRGPESVGLLVDGVDGVDLRC